MYLRALSTAALVLCLGSLSACDDKKDAKTDEKSKTDEKKTDVKAEEKKAEPEEKKAEPEEKKAEPEEKKADEAKADEAKADEAKADEAKADEKKADDPKKPADPKKPKDPKKPDEAKTDPPPASGADGKDIFGKKCKSCHGPTGDAKTKIGQENDIEDWTQAGWKGKWPESKIVDIVTNGKAGTKMKSFKEKLTADEIAAVAKYARSLGK